MKRSLLVIGAAALFGGAAWFSARPPVRAHSGALLTLFEAQVGALAASLDTLSASAASGNAAQARAAFRAARQAYKRSETLLEFYAPVQVRFLNGPSPDADPDLPPPPPGLPSAFERVDDALREHGTTERKRAAAVSDSMARMIHKLAKYVPMLSITDSVLFDAARLEVARISTLGIAGFDAPDSHDAMDEEAAAVDGMRALFTAGPSDPSVDASLAQAARMLRDSPDFDRFDRLTFIVRGANVAARAIAAARASGGYGAPQLRRSWRASAATVFDSGAFDASAYAPEFARAASPPLVTLGRRLFYDPRLSGPGTRSCSSCHDPARAFADGLARPATLEPAQRATARNTPTLVNAALQPLLFADEHAGSLEEQIMRVLASDAEMRSSADKAAERVRGDTTYAALFASAFARTASVARQPADSIISALNVRIALAAYLRTLVSLDSRADRALRGDTLALSHVERLGLNIYMGKARCATCHYLPLTGGTVPPAFDESELEIIGVPRQAVTQGATIDPDSGRERVDHAVEHRYAFRVPSLRNVALTAPYMHNGAYATLDDVIDFYDRGGGRGIGAIVPGQTLPEQRLRLIPAEKEALVAFLRALTDSTPMMRERSLQHRAR